ncbi:MAG: hypothetical protein PF542_05295 [Nanoarchaeota archaeon]|nr:hypothetical protein [Nanoarchaeota archaeon]
MNSLIGTAIGVTGETLLGIAQCYGYYYAAKEGYPEVLDLPAATNFAFGYQNLVDKYINRGK